MAEEVIDVQRLTISTEAEPTWRIVPGGPALFLGYSKPSDEHPLFILLPDNFERPGLFKRIVMWLAGMRFYD